MAAAAMISVSPTAQVVKPMKKAFTIIELVIVISVLIILISIAIPRMKGMQQSGTIAKVRAELQTFQAAVESYYNNSSPSSYPGVAGSTSQPIVYTVGATYLISSTPQILSSPLYDPFNHIAPNTEYAFYLSPGGQYYVISSDGPNGIWGCFMPGTKVLLANGDSKTVEKLNTGDILLGLQKSHNKLIHLQILPKQNKRIYSFNGGRYFVTSDHPFMTLKGWKAIDPHLAKKNHPELELGQLQVNDELVTFKGPVQLKKIESRVLKNLTVYNPQLDGNHTYYADGFLVHNAAVPYSGPIVSDSGLVSFPSGKGDDLCVTNGTGC